MRKLNVWVVAGSVFAVVGLVCLGMALALSVSSARFAQTAQRAEGTVVDIQYSGGYRSSAYPYVTYVCPVDGREYTFRDRTGSRPPAYAIGERVTVAYNPARPADAQIDSSANKLLGPLVCGGFGIVFTAIGSVLLIKARRRAVRSTWLRTRGRERWVPVTHIDLDYGVQLNGRYPYVVRASWLDEQTGRSHTASSDHLWYDPGPDLLDRQVRVLFDPADPDRNLIDLEGSRSNRY